ncbi:MAG: 7-carboxy-7-deazaguanine synthase [Chroococcopsis gigantea SAG 12.99]|jgi:7-carboxy-7-deazaguanine synthase|nr:7-carboxy-7-deazaguanine synthase [Chroococcopsis gigantea SAG 12.99]
MKTVSINNFTYPIVETFHSIQGEGAWTGVNALFIRLAGCDVGCPWCDQKESWSAKGYTRRSIPELTLSARQSNPAIVVITGGEPLLHDLNPLTKELKSLGLRIHLETSGAHRFTGCFDWVTFSPKPYKSPHESIYAQASELKVVIDDEQDLQWAEIQGQKVGAGVVKYLQPQWTNPRSQELVFDYVLGHPDWRVSLQTHKFLGVR